jgi:hypothetical protein
MGKNAPKPLPKSPLERSIELRQRAIQRAEEKKKEVRRIAEEKCAEIDKGIANKRVLLDALKRGAIKP